MCESITTEIDKNRRRASFVIIAVPLIVMSATMGMAYDVTTWYDSMTRSVLRPTTEHWTAHSLERQYNKVLCGNYRIIRTGPTEVVVLRRSSSAKETDALADPTNGTFVGGNIKQVAVSEPYVTGYAAPLDGLEMSEIKTGYFVLDAEKDELKEGLSKERWRQELERLGWPTPNLKEPS